MLVWLQFTFIQTPESVPFQRCKPHFLEVENALSLNA